MTDAPDGWRVERRPATLVTCRVEPPEMHSTDGQGWLRVEAANATSTEASLTILAGWGGGGKYGHTEVVETERDVTIRVLIQHRVPTVREPGVMYVETLELRTGLVEVHLAAPLGERALIGEAADDPFGRSLRSERWVAADRPFIDVVTSGRVQPR
jgi:hypothetical protein